MLASQKKAGNFADHFSANDPETGPKIAGLKVTAIPMIQ